MSLQQHPATTAVTAHAVAQALGFAPGAMVLAHAPHAVPGCEALEARLNSLYAEAGRIMAVCGRDPEGDQRDRINRIAAEVEVLERQLETANQFAAEVGPPGQANSRFQPGNVGPRSGRPAMRQIAPMASYRAGSPAPAPAPAKAAAKPAAKRLPSETDPQRWGFGNFAEFVAAVKIGSAKAGQVDPRLVLNSAPNSYGSEGVGQDGGFAVPPEFRDSIIEKVLGEQSLLPLTDQQIASRNSITFPADETTPVAVVGWNPGLLGIRGQGDATVEARPEGQDRQAREDRGHGAAQR
ncbi:phage major capsid protein [Aquincola sp. J276]|uniref:phage major capsid protein n=1 Tax=Aquincola sp. J276 TaxID=2898432 RepID=UPI0021509ED1|nr:phage major capsid protein [Aquincola sp. J276]MCR5865222.1 phage major capsid protein [Aquincola sp. J276]